MIDANLVIRKLTIRLIIISLALLSKPAFAYDCLGGVSELHVNGNGVVSAGGVAGLSWVYFCSVSNNLNGVSPEACRAIYATLLAAQTTGKKVRLWFNDSGGCNGASHPAWGWLSGWYWGPSLVD